MAFSQYLSTALLDWIKGTAFPAAGATLYISVHTADPGLDGLTGDATSSVRGDANRVSVTASAFTSPGPGGGGIQMSNTGTIQVTSDAANVSPVRLTHFGIWTANSGGNLLASGALSSGVDVVENDSVQFNVGALVIRGV